MHHDMYMKHVKLTQKDRKLIVNFVLSTASWGHVIYNGVYIWNGYYI